ncbi:serine/threonine-protein kinase RIO3-like [Clytia hemisphaerica]|uniref:Serine/threonine-protein kinase RIO3 n=1 Tax=Clytia hemisphaerica TaxID=252671 RepID=A0A7M5XAG4_9CNID
MATKIIDVNNPSGGSQSATTCPWGKIQNTPPASSFSSLMDEEYAKELESEELKSLSQEQDPVQTETQVVIPPEAATNGSDDTANDLLLAQMLQLEFNKENDAYVKSLEKTYNGTSKVSMSFKNFQSVHPYEADSSRKLYGKDDFDDDSSEEDSDLDDAINERKADGEIITKHDQQISERKNAKNVEQFPLHFASGDVGRKDIRLPNAVYNRLKTHSKKEERNNMRIHEKQEHSTHEKALDEKSRLILYKMVNNGTLDSISGIVSTGKEAVVIHARGGQSENGPLPSECALKIFKTTLNEFKTREKYIKDDHRFRDRYSKQNPRKIIKLWAEKEFRNLNRMQEAGIPCPKVVCLRKHILVMTFVGADQKPAPKLKDAILSRRELESAYSQCTEMMKTMYNECKLIHSDLSEYNILWHYNKCFFIDVSQSIEPVHPQAFHFLLRDCHNITSFFTKAGLTTDIVMKEEELFKYVCGKELGETCLDQIENEQKPNFERDEEMLAFGLNSDANFDYQFKFNQSKLDQAKHNQSEESTADQSADSKVNELADMSESISTSEN